MSAETEYPAKSLGRIAYRRSLCYCKNGLESENQQPRKNTDAYPLLCAAPDWFSRTAARTGKQEPKAFV